MARMMMSRGLWHLSSGASVNRRWLTRDRLRAIFGYPFDDLGCQMVFARHAENGPRRLWRHLGASEHIIPRLRGRGAAEVIATLTEEAWRAYGARF
jgi:hypothetical protein